MPAPFKLERFFAQYDLKVRDLLSASDCESLSMRELLALAETDSRERWDQPAPEYTESQGDPALRAEISAQSTEQGPDNELALMPGTIFNVPGGRFRPGLGRRNFSEALAGLEAELANY